MISQYKLLFYDYQNLNQPITSEQVNHQSHVTQLTNVTNYVTNVSTNESVILNNESEPSTSHFLTNQIEDRRRMPQGVSQSAPSLGNVTTNKITSKEKLQSDGTFRRPSNRNSPFRRPSIPVERKSPTNEVKTFLSHTFSPIF